jgi:phospholipid transport system substrate-binding protein
VAHRGDSVEDATAGDPLRSLQCSEEMLQASLRRRVPDWSPEADVVKERVSAILAGMLDYDGLSRRALGPDWETLTEAQRLAFVHRFSALTNQSFTEALGRSDVRLRFDSETVIGPVAGVIVTALGPGSEERTFDYRMARNHGRWLIYDVLANRESLVGGNRVEFSRLLRRSGFNELIARMDRRLAHPGRPEVRP